MWRLLGRVKEVILSGATAAQATEASPRDRAPRMGPADERRHASGDPRVLPGGGANAAAAQWPPRSACWTPAWVAHPSCCLQSCFAHGCSPGSIPEQPDGRPRTSVTGGTWNGPLLAWPHTDGDSLLCCYHSATLYASDATDTAEDRHAQPPRQWQIPCREVFGKKGGKTISPASLWAKTTANRRGEPPRSEWECHRSRRYQGDRFGSLRKAPGPQPSAHRRRHDEELTGAPSPGFGRLE